MEMKELRPDFGLDYLGLKDLRNTFWNLSTASLYEMALKRNEGQLADMGPLVVSQGQHRGRAAKDKYIVEEEVSKDNIWWGKVNVAYSEDKFNDLLDKMSFYLRGKDVFVQDCYVGADEDYRHPVRVVSEFAWHNIFVRNMFLELEHESEKIKNFIPEFTVLQCPGFHSDPDDDDTRSGTFVAVNVKKKLVLIGGTAYAGEIKKSIFSAMNYLLPDEDVLPMHCSANVNKKDENDVAIFFGLSGTGKTTLSADPERALIGDDEHGWSDNGVFNFEGGCYAKVINLSKESEPEIFECTRKFGTILENVPLDPVTKKIDLFDGSYTENTRASYPLSSLPNIVPSGKATHPKTVIMLTADAFGVLPPISQLSPEQAMYHFISGYTAKLAGTEKGVTEPSATFSACFGAPFMMRHPSVYAKLLAARIEKYDAKCWLVNTGWTGGAYGTGHRMSITHTRTLLNAALNGELNDVEFVVDPNFGFKVPTSAPNVPAEILDPKNTWADKDAYDAQALKLVGLFHKNFEQFRGNTSDDIINAGPRAL